MNRLSKCLLLFAGCYFALSVVFAVPKLQAEDKPFNQGEDNQQGNEKAMSAEEALKTLKLPEGFHATLFAKEPDIRQPVAMTTDERGRLWVVENYTYDNNKINYNTKLNDRILIFEDTNNDGKFDNRKVFWDQGKKITSVAVGFGGVYVLAAPDMLFIPDKDRDDVPDSEPIVMLDGWDHGGIRHNIVNGLMWGPDGWLYGRHGIQATSVVGKPGTPKEERVQLNCSVWRYHPVHQTFEVVTRGTTNSWGMDYNEVGEIFFINTVIGHLWHAVPGARFKRMYGTHFNPYLYDLIDHCADHLHWDTGEKWNDAKKNLTDGTSKAGGGHAHCGMMIYLGDNWPKSYRNNVFTLNFHGRRINQDHLVREGNAYVGKHGKDMAFFEDIGFRGIELTYGPDGGVYVLDWSDVGECHENDGVVRSTGRIYKITYQEPKAVKAFDLSKLDDQELVQLQTHENEWYARQSRRILQERAATEQKMEAATQALQQLYTSSENIPHKLRAMWALYAINQTTPSWLREQLSHSNENIRVWAIRLLTDQGKIDSESLETFEKLAKDDSSGLVRLYLASTLQKLPVEQRWGIAEGLAMHEEDATDRMQPLMLWYGIEASIPKDPVRAVKLASTSKIPLLRRFIARRLSEN